MKFTKKYDYMYRRMIANIPLGIARNTFKDWWKELGKIVDSVNKTK